MKVTPMKNILLILSVFFLHPVSAQTITTIAGTGVGTYNGDNIPAIGAQLNATGLAVDPHDNLMIADYDNCRIRKISGGIITTIAGNGTCGFSGDNGPATDAELNNPVSVAVDKLGNIYIADFNNHRIRKVDESGNITTITGGGLTYIDGEPATATGLGGLPTYVTVDTFGAIYIANEHVYKINLSGNINIVAGLSGAGLLGDGGPATAAQLIDPLGVAVDNSGNIYFTDEDRLREVTTSGIISTIAGTDTCGFSGNGGPAIDAAICNPIGVKIDRFSNIVFTDPAHYNSCVRIISASGIINSIAGNHTFSYSGDKGPATAAGLNSPRDIAIDSRGGIYMSDEGNYRIRYITNAVAVPGFDDIQPGLVVSPNPSSGDFNIKATSAIDQDVSILFYNMLGQKIKQLTVAANISATVHLDAPPGIYYLSATMQSKVLTQKIVIR